MRREYWLGLTLAGLGMMLPLGWLTFVLLLVIPGLAILLLLKDRMTLSELIGVSGTLSILVFPLVILFISPVSVRLAGILLGLIVIAAGFYGFWKRKTITVDTSDWQVQVIAALIFLIVLFIMLKTFVITDKGLEIATTHASDLNWHLSIAQRFIEAPQLPPQDPYLPGYEIVYNWFMQVVFGELTLLTGLSLFEVFKVLITFVSALIFIDAYLLARTIFDEDLKASLLAGIIYVVSSGLSWLYLAYLALSDRSIDMFRILIFEWTGIMGLKYDSPSLYMLLPQTQTFGLLAMIFGLYIYLQAVSKKSLAISIVAGVALASLVMFHVITAFPVFMALGLYFLYLLFKERKQILGNRDLSIIPVAAIPLIMAAIATIYEIMLMSSNAGSQISLGHHPDVYVTLLVTLGPLLPFAIWGMYRAKNNQYAVLLMIFAVLNFVFLNIFEMTMTHNTYRFLVYLALPVSLFAGLALSKWLFSASKLKIITAALIILALVPSTVCIIMFYNDSSYVHAPPGDVKAAQWIKANTPRDAVIYEEPTHFVRVPVMTGRNDAYAGEIYTLQYHNVNKQREMEAILHMTDKDALYNTMLSEGVDYVFVGSKESGYSFAETLKSNPGFTVVYDEEGVKIYQVNRP
ncbi:DUF2298 domain-containing protein [Methanocella arvoryzae]|uniref:Uncharacterized protein n=1 Tax=Methanocella arvoryzae (strain DSM 22066 / NBRC 105507 / MRE50) TaxID=351160 RepID=Q0W0G6_METAR|nr:DUF2298 domain-containing protein [Methanocella arvoryzae]CAJ38127.1 hypothetical protein RRC424 [Methanocella arvoryzae MRE50]